jgi:hypothetical protein
MKFSTILAQICHRINAVIFLCHPWQKKCTEGPTKVTTKIVRTVVRLRRRIRTVLVNIIMVVTWSLILWRHLLMGKWPVTGIVSSIPVRSHSKINPHPIYTLWDLAPKIIFQYLEVGRKSECSFIERGVVKIEPGSHSVDQTINKSESYK